MKGPLKSISFLIRFFIVFGRLLSSNTAARRRPRRVQDAPLTRQDVARTRSEPENWSSDAKDGLESDLGPIWAVFWSILGRILDGFLNDLGVNFG